MARILLIDDDDALIDVLALSFEDEGHEVLCAPDGQRGLARLLGEGPELVISDVNMPHVDGFTLLRRAREGGFLAPIVLLTSRDSEIDEALGLELGADDYVAKPFSTRVLMARVRALLRREALRSTPVVAGLREVGRLSLDRERIEARFAGVMLELTVTEFRLLEALTSRPGVVYSRPRLMEMARGDDSVVAERIIDTYVRRLRRKMEAIDAEFDHIETVIGAGYRWRDG
ncbi:MAG: response regulator transcription factor [Alphaproteobacteria bacterium]|nr:response regulator transcription factor [Alphaproteobacteria bacterium]MCB9794469.1 response regulator transcription factor [Alphaproteobacteria bacterium]